MKTTCPLCLTGETLTETQMEIHLAAQHNIPRPLSQELTDFMPGLVALLNLKRTMRRRAERRWN